MEDHTTRTITPARAVALAVIAVLIGGLMYFRIHAGSDPVSVPAGAKAGELRLRPCHCATENGSYPADCGTLVEPENRANPRSRLIALPVTRIRARSAGSGEPIFRLEGGPGLTNMKFPNASRFAGDHDVVLVGYRGVDGSSPLNCPEVVSALKHSTDFLSAPSSRAYTDAFRASAARLSGDGVDLAGYSLAQRVDDLEAARRALGYGTVDLLSESAGTRTAMIYARRYPQSIHRSVMLGAHPPGHFVWDAQTIDQQIGAYADLCAKDDTCRKRTADLVASMKGTAEHIPDHWWFLPIKKGNVRIASFYGLMHSSAEAAPISAPMTLDSWLSAAKGDPSGFWFMSLAADLTFPQSFVWGDLAATGRTDAQTARDYFSSGRQRGSILGDPASTFLWAGGHLADAWPATPNEDEYSSMQTSNVETLVISGTLDFATPPAVATNELLPYLPNGHQVLLQGFGHTTDVWTHQKEAGNRLINTFFDKGQVDDSLYRPLSVDFTPEVSQPWLAKGIAGTMIGFALVAVLSLLWMPRRVHRRGQFGRKASATLRSLYPIVLGLGGWFLGALIVITTEPGVPLDDQLLVVLSVGVPIGLGIYWAWVHRDWASERKGVGLATAVAGAVMGAWLGFHATAGLLALATTIIGAIAGANLAVIALDMVQARSAGPPPAPQTTAGSPEPRLEPAMPRS